MKTKAFKIIISAVLIVSLAGVAFLIFSKPGSPLSVDISGVDADLDMLRFDEDLFADYQSIEDHVKWLEEKYPDFFPLFSQQIIHIGNSGDKSFYKYLETFMQDYSVMQGKAAVEKEFSDISDVGNQLESSFKHYKYYFPEADLPRIVFFIAGFNHSVVTTESLIGVGLDKYLGADNELYDMMQIPRYASQNMRREMIPVDCMTAWFNMEYPNTDTTDYLVCQMIYEGQRMYFLDAMLPEVPDALKIGYTDSQLAYCEHFEPDMWAYYVSEELLFSTDYLLQRKFLGDAPFTAAFGQESPGRAAIWTGWQIVRSWAEENKLSVQEVIKETDYQKILNQSYYEPN